MTTNEICTVMQAAERKAAELILHAHGVMTERKSGARDVVTQYDRAVQQLLMDGKSSTHRSCSSSIPSTAR